MSQNPQPVCITCSLPVGDPPRLNRLGNGQVCPSCRDRLLDALPPILPHRGIPSPAVEEAENWGRASFDGDDPASGGSR